MPEVKRDENDVSRLPKIVTGTRVEVFSPTDQRLFAGKIQVMKKSFLGRFFIQIAEEAGQSVPKVERDTLVKIKGFQENGIPFSMHGYVLNSTEKFWRLDRLETLQKDDLRKYYRQTIKIPATLMCVNNIFRRSDDAGKKDIETVPCTILDISGGGVRVECEGSAEFALEDYLFLSAAEPTNNELRMNYTCCIRRIRERKESCEYGCEFVGLMEAEKERLLKVITDVQRRELRLRRSSEARK